jgi:predicted lipid-binding transport protein (Tim44 family)
MSSADAVNLVGGLLTGILSSSAFVLALFLGFCIVLGFPKLRSTLGHKSMVIKSLDEKVGQEAFSRYLTPDAPYGPIDVLRTPELLEHARKTS